MLQVGNKITHNAELSINEIKELRLIDTAIERSGKLGLSVDQYCDIFRDAHTFSTIDEDPTNYNQDNEYLELCSDLGNGLNKIILELNY